MSVRLRLGLAFLVVAGLFLVPVRYAGGRLNELREMAVELRSQHAMATLSLGTFRASLASFDSNQRAYLVTLDGRLGRQVDDALADMATQIGRLETAGYGQVTGPLSATLDSLASLSGAIDEHVAAGRVEPATRVFERVAPVSGQLVAQLEVVAEAVDRSSAADFARANEVVGTAATTTVVATIAALVLALIIGLWTTGALTLPLTKLSTAAARVADGTFEQPEGLPYARGDEIGDLSRSFRTMTQRLAELDRMKAEFMSVASHELKTPVSVIRGYTELIEEELAEDMTERQAEILGAIREQTAAVTRLVSRLLDIGRLEAGTYGMEPEEIHVSDLLKGLARSFEVIADEHDIEFVTDAAPGTPETVRADPDLLRNEVLGNLVSNALRFTPEGGSVTVKVWREDDEVVFEVSDTGPGIQADQRPYIFDKYYEGDRTQSMGSGLGLAVAKEVTEAHGGRITLEPPDGPGATFRVYLPLDDGTGDGAVS